jgi:hypothetical protein
MGLNPTFAHVGAVELSAIWDDPCQEKCTSSSDNDAKVLRLPHKTTFDVL